MSTPRKPYGPNPPGRLPSTMIKVLAAELSDSSRLARGKRYWADDAVIDIVIGHGAVTAEVQGSRSEPYVVTLEAAAGSGVPTKRELWVRCTCPDDARDGDAACKHAVAALFVVADEIAIDPELLDRWRTSSRAARPSSRISETEPRERSSVESTAHQRTSDDDDVHADDADVLADVIELRARHDPGIDEISVLLQAPDGTAVPDLPTITSIEHPTIRDRLVADVLDDVLSHLELRWE